MKWLTLDGHRDPLALAHDERQRFARAAVAHTFDQSVLRASLLEAVHEQATAFSRRVEINQAETIALRSARFPTPDAKAEDYCERVAQIGTLGRALVGIRWAGLDPARPFVDIWPDFAPIAVADLELLAQVVAAEFRVFVPRHLRIFLSPASSLAGLLRTSGALRQIYLAASVHEVCRSTAPQGPGDFELRVPDDAGYYDWYAEAYARFHAAHPELAPWVCVNDKQEMEASREQGLLRVAYLRGITVGLIAACSQSLLGLRGAYFIESLLVPPFKGQGLAPFMQRRFIDGLGPEYEIVWGTIDAGNLPSRRAAEKVGRRVVREEFFVPLQDGTPPALGDVVPMPTRLTLP